MKGEEKYIEIALCTFYNLNVVYFDGGLRDICIKCSKQLKWHSFFCVSGQSRPFWAALNHSKIQTWNLNRLTHIKLNVWGRIWSLKVKWKNRWFFMIFSAHTVNYVCHSIRSMFRVLDIYNFGWEGYNCRFVVSTPEILEVCQP